MVRLDQTDSARVEVAVDCGNSPKMQFLKDFNIAFARADIDALSAAVTEDIRWNMVGDQLIEGKAGFTAALREMSGEKPKAMSISKVVTHGKAGAVNGQLIMQNGKKYAFCDVYEFKSVKGDRIASIDSYVIELKP
ncbi:DNA-binding protein [Flavilitoribacter nigricans DSM 23189 = NBRC 102662]|uniref:DNA-binding protein n=2 Tax=Flavilitoribacter TaxID=2762562 RepID=A0A2D0N9T0_FLAN2|nr:DNA-binding protein [Flavilitoribacter nigricans DSM 23189 = NBRC 102662]